jgi:hypothetical protein
MVDTRYPALAQIEFPPPDVIVNDDPGEPVPTKVIKSEELAQIGNHLDRLFTQFVSDRRILELKWLRNLRQYLGQHDPEMERSIGPNRSKAYPRITRVKAVTLLSHIMNLMFPGNERNWELKASPSPDLDPQDIMQAIQGMMEKNAEAGVDSPPDEEMLEAAIKQMAEERAEDLSELIDDQLQEIGGDQTLDIINLTRKVLFSGILYGLGVLEGPFPRPTTVTQWDKDPYSGFPMPTLIDAFKPTYEFTTIWDFYPDLTAKTLRGMDRYFTRKVMGRSQVKALKKRPGFFSEQIDLYLKQNNVGNYKAQPFEQDLRMMGVKVNVNEQKPEADKYEVIIWHGPLSAKMLELAGVDIPDELKGEDIEAEVWMLGGRVIKADMNEWRKLGVENMRIYHYFLFDEDDTSPIGNGLPNNMRDSQMSITASVRMLLDNASVVCGPNLELNTDLLRLDQDLAAIAAYKFWYREGTGPDAAQPAVRNIQIDSHIDELMKVVDLFMKFADLETFIGSDPGSNMNKMPSEPFRTAAGASMLRGQEQLPFKDIIRSFDSFTQSVIQALVTFNKKFNPDLTPKGDFNVIALGATSLIAKELRGQYADQLAQSLTPAEAVHVDERKMIETRFKVRDMGDCLISSEEAKRRQAAQAQESQEQREMQTEMLRAQIRTELASAMKEIAQAQKNLANADATKINAALDILEAGAGGDANGEGTEPAEGADGADGSASDGQGDTGDQGPPSFS